MEKKIKEPTKKPAVEYNPELIYKFFEERKRDYLKKVRFVLESHNIEKHIVEAVIIALKNS